MSEETAPDPGYVYILEVKDIDLPVSKIGKTTRDPYLRCEEINRSSTGDFLWEVAHFVAVNDCGRLESIAHEKLAPLRQKRREFFNIDAEKAWRAVQSILNHQQSIHLIDLQPLPSSNKSSSSGNKHPKSFSKRDARYANLLHAFNSHLGIKGRPFGQLNQPRFGMSDGAEGVQWNLVIDTATGIIKLGINLEGLKYRNWPIASFTLNQLQSPQQILDLRDSLSDPRSIFIRFARDAWQATARPEIVEPLLGGAEHSLADLDITRWMSILHEALACLDGNRGYRGRAKRMITLTDGSERGREPRLMPVSPHLTIWTPVESNDDWDHELSRHFEKLRPIHDWVSKTCISD